MGLTAAALNRTTLLRQHLLARTDLDPVEAVRSIGLLQAQSPPSIHLSLAARLHDVDFAAIDAALRDRRLVRTSLLRLTLHLVPTDEVAWWFTAMQPRLRAGRLNDQRFRGADMAWQEADAAVPALLEAAAAAPLSKADGEAALAAVGLADPAMAWWALRNCGPLTHAPTDAPWVFDESTSPREAPPVPLRTTPVEEDGEQHLAAVGRVVARYLAAFGPASANDVAQATMLPMRSIRPAVAALGDTVVEVAAADGQSLWDVAGAPVADGGEPAPARLLPMWDSTMLVYADRSRILPERFRKLVIRSNGDTLPTMLVDGHVAGLWRGVDGGVELHAFEDLPPTAWDDLAEEAARVATLLADRDPRPHDRYRRWWDRLPPGHVHLVPVD